jgi:O-antigen ligase
MVAAAIVDAMLRRRFLWLPVYALAYILSYSGTGLLGLLVALALYPLVSPKQIGATIGFAAVGLIAVVAIWFVFPAPVEAILQRSNELELSRSSGYARYVAQGEAWEYFSSSSRMLIGHGPGAFQRSPPYVPGSGNPAIKLFADYGLIGLLLFILLIVRSFWNAAYPILSLFFLALYQLGGGNILLPPFLNLAALLCIWSKPSYTKKGRFD